MEFRLKKYKKIKQLVNTLESITCDKCKKEYKKDDTLEIQEFHHINFTGGYGSVFGDMCSIECDICQHCLFEMIHKFCKIESLWKE